MGTLSNSLINGTCTCAYITTDLRDPLRRAALPLDPLFVQQSADRTTIDRWSTIEAIDSAAPSLTGREEEVGWPRETRGSIGQPRTMRIVKWIPVNSQTR